MIPEPQNSSPAKEWANSTAETRTAILDAAEELFAELGVDGTSVRDITRLANVNLGAINYHFGTKDRLAVEVFIRALEPANKRRLALLDHLEKQAAGKPLTLERILEALIRPMIECGNDKVRSANAFAQLTSRSFQESNPEIKLLVKARFGEICERFDAAISRALPDIPHDMLFWRMHFIFGAMHHALSIWLRFEYIAIPGRAPHRRLDAEELVQQLIACSSAALRAQLPPTPQKEF